MSKAELSREGQEWRRLRAWELWQQGWKQKDIATALGVTKGAESQWIKRSREERLRHRRETLQHCFAHALGADELVGQR
jgi:predicted transcriptional regulator